MFTPWKCGDCGAHGEIRREREHTAADIARWAAKQHARKSPECHQRAQLAQAVTARLTARDRHILITARIKRKLMADAIRVRRKADWDAAAALEDGPYRSAVLARTRKEWLAGKVTRKGYAFT